MDNFRGLYETLGYIVVRGDPEEHFLDYGFCKQNSKILYSCQKKRNPSSFSCTIFKTYKLQYESGFSQTTYSNLYYFLPSTTNRSKEINRYLGFINLSETAFETKQNVSFDPSKLEFNCQEKEIMTGAVAKMLKKIIDMLNTNRWFVL